MLTLQKFEKLVESPLAKRQVTLSWIGQNGEKIAEWATSLAVLDKHEQCRRLKRVLAELVVADIDDEKRFSILQKLFGLLDRVIAQMHSEYVNNPQNQNLEQKVYMDEVRNLYFLSILGLTGVAHRLYSDLNQEGLPVTRSSIGSQKKNGWLQKLTGSLSSNVVRNGANINLLEKPKAAFTLAVYHIIATCYKLLFEFAIAYQKPPQVIWKILNSWYLKSAVLGMDKFDISKISDLKADTVNHQYLQCCAVSFTNFFAYRRPDIVSIFKIFPKWAKLTKSAFVAKKHHRIFVNLQSSHPPEVISPHASINPYSENAICLFFDVKELFVYIKSLGSSQSPSGSNVFEQRLAKIIMLAFDREAEETILAHKVSDYSVDVLMGFGSIFREIAEGRSFKQVICQSKLPEEYRPKHVFEMPIKYDGEKAKLIHTSESGGRFLLDKNSDGLAQDGEVEILTRPFLSVFTLFALKNPQVTNKHPWRLGIIHWVQDTEQGVAVDGKFLGRILSVCGVRLAGHDLRNKGFVQAFLLAGDGLNKQTTLILPRYHFKAGDTVILRVEEKQTTLRLEQNLLSTDDIEQYQIVRLA